MELKKCPRATFFTCRCRRHNRPRPCPNPTKVYYRIINAGEWSIALCSANMQAHAVGLGAFIYLVVGDENGQDESRLSQHVGWWSIVGTPSGKLQCCLLTYRCILSGSTAATFGASPRNLSILIIQCWWGGTFWHYQLAYRDRGGPIMG